MTFVKKVIHNILTWFESTLIVKKVIHNIVTGFENHSGTKKSHSWHFRNRITPPPKKKKSRACDLFFQWRGFNTTNFPVVLSYLGDTFQTTTTLLSNCNKHFAEENKKVFFIWAQKQKLCKSAEMHWESHGAAVATTPHPTEGERQLKKSCRLRRRSWAFKRGKQQHLMFLCAWWT